MPIRITLVACAKNKRQVPSPARDLYASPLFQKMRRFAEQEADAWYILSAKHGVIRPDEVVSPYEATLNTMSQAERLAWALNVQSQLVEKIPCDAEVTILAGKRYREYIVPFLRKRGFRTAIPLEGLSLGKQLQWLNEHAPL